MLCRSEGCTAVQELQTECVVYNVLFHSDQLKEIQFRHPPSKTVTSQWEGKDSAVPSQGPAAPPAPEGHGARTLLSCF